MRKLVFMLKVNPNLNSVTPKNLEISTHRGARLMIRGNQATVLDVTDDEMTDSELQLWYRSRYSGLGMGITIMHDPEVKVSAPEPETKTVVSEEKPVKTKKQVKKEKPVTVEVKQENIIPVEKVSVVVSEPVAPVSKVEPKIQENTVPAEVPVEQASIETSIEQVPVKADLDEDAGAVAELQSFLWG